MTLPAVPPGWTPMEQYIENVPDPNAGTPAARTYARVSYRTTWTAKQVTLSDGSPDELASQAQARYESAPIP